jgi:hypothetical protein
MIYSTRFHAAFAGEKRRASTRVWFEADPRVTRSASSLGKASVRMGTALDKNKGFLKEESS